MRRLRLMTIRDFTVLDRDGNPRYYQDRIGNTLHNSGGEFLLKAVFGTLSVPAVFVLGLDGRTAIEASDTMSDLQTSGEPTGNGYARVSVDREDFVVEDTGVDGLYQLVSPILQFRATGGSWGPARALFLTTDAGYTGYLIASAPLASPLTLADGESFTLRMAFSLGVCDET